MDLAALSCLAIKVMCFMRCINIIDVKGNFLVEFVCERLRKFFLSVVHDLRIN